MDYLLIALNFCKKYGPYIVIYILLLFIGYQCVHKPEPVDPIVVNNNKLIVANQSLITTLLAKEEELIKKRKDDSVQFMKREIAYKRKISVLEKKKDVIIQQLQPMIDTIPQLSELVAMYDTINVQKDKRIQEVNLEKIQLKHDFEVHLALDENKFKASTEMNEHFKDLANTYREKNRKLRRQNNWLKVGAAALVVGIVFKQ